MAHHSSLDDQILSIRDRLLSLPGSSPLDDRRALAEAVRSQILRGAPAPLASAALATLAQAVVDDPLRCDLAALKQAGWSEEAIFELVLTAATSVGHAQLEQAVRALAEANS